MKSNYSTAELLPIIYDELRVLATSKIDREKPGQTLQPTALVHEVFLRLSRGDQNWQSSGHFFSAAATAMRRILIEVARRKAGPTRGGHLERISFHDQLLQVDSDHERLIELDDALNSLAEVDPRAAQVAELRVFAGLSIQATAEAMQVSTTTAFREWQFASAWLKSKL